MTPETFKEIRLALGYSQARLAIILGVSHGTISNWEQGYRPIPEEYEEKLTGMAGLCKSCYGKGNTCEGCNGVDRDNDMCDVCSYPSWSCYGAPSLKEIILPNGWRSWECPHCGGTGEKEK